MEGPGWLSAVLAGAGGSAKGGALGPFSATGGGPHSGALVAVGVVGWAAVASTPGVRSAGMFRCHGTLGSLPVGGRQTPDAPK